MRERVGIFGQIVEGIDVSAIDREGRKVLRAALLDELKQDWSDFIRPYPEMHNYPRDAEFSVQQRWSENMSDLYDQFYQKFSNHKSPEGYRLFVERLLRTASKALTDLVQRHVREKYARERWGDVPIKLPGGYTHFRVEDFIVDVVAREWSEDADKSYGGYFQRAWSDNTTIVRVFVSGDDVHTTAMALIQELIYGEAENSEDLINIIAPVFTHEYVHLEQHLRGASFDLWGNDLGFVTKGGGRWGGRRKPRDGTVPYMRYKSSLKEIEAFAAEAASEIIEQISRRHYGFNEHISQALVDLAQGYHSSNIASHYLEIVEGYWNQIARDEGVSQAELRQTYQHFLKKIYAKLWAYREQRIGKSDNKHFFTQVPPQWLEFAKKYPLSRCAAMIAYDISFHYEFIDFGEGRQKVELGARFLEAYYFEQDWNYDKSMKIQSAFTKLVERYAKERALRRAA